MEIKHTAMAGTLESSDAFVTVEPGDGAIRLEITSPVIHQYGNQIHKVVLNVLSALEVCSATVTVTDHGALDCTLKARVENAVFRAADCAEEPVPWGGKIR